MTPDQARQGCQARGYRGAASQHGHRHGQRPEAVQPTLGALLTLDAEVDEGGLVVLDYDEARVVTKRHAID